MPASSPPRRVVEVLVADGTADGAGLDDTVRELLGRLSLVTETQSVGQIDAEDARFRSTARPSMLARVGIDLRTQDAAIITIVDGRTGEVTLRRTVRRDGPPAVVREEVAHVVQSAIDPLIVTERDRTSPPPPPPPPVADVAGLPAPTSDRDAGPTEPGTKSPLALDVVTAAGGGSYAPGAGLIARAGGGATLVWRRGLRPAIGVQAHYVFPFESGPPIASAHVSIVALRILPALEVLSSPVFALDVAVGGGVDVLRVEPRSNALPEDRLGDTVSRASPLLTSSLTGHVAIRGDTAVSLLIGTDVDLTARRWIVDAAGERSAAFAPSRLRPLAMLGFTFTAFGESRFGRAAR